MKRSDHTSKERESKDSSLDTSKHTQPSCPGSDTIRIQQVRTKKDFRDFYDLSFRIYQNDTNFVPSFWVEFKAFFNDRNPFWSHARYQLFLVYKKNIIAGRIAVFIDDLYCKRNNERTGFFGFFECIKDYSCAQMLFKTAEDWLRSKGMTRICGPIDGRIDMGFGLLIEGFDDPSTLLSTYNHRYYPSFCERYTMQKSRDFYEYRIDLTKPLPLLLEQKANACHIHGISLRTFRRFHTSKELQWWIPFFLDTFKDHWGYVPVSEEEVRSRFGVKQMRWTIDPRLFLIAEKDDRPVAFLFSTPEYHQIFKEMNGKLGVYGYIRFLIKRRKIDEGKLHIIGIKEDLRHHHLGSFLNYHVLIEMKKRGYTSAIVSVIDEQNQHAHETITVTGAQRYKRYRVYEKKIDKINEQ